MPRVLLLSAWREIRQGLERLRTPALATPRLTDASISLREVANWDGKSLGIYQVLAAAFNAEDYLDCIKYLPARNIDPLSYINSLDKVGSLPVFNRNVWFTQKWQQIIDSLPSDLDLRKRCIRALRKTCGLNGILPTSHVISFTLCQPSQRAFASGGYSDIWRLADKRNPDLVFAVKSLRVYEQDYSETINKVRNFSICDWIRGFLPIGCLEILQGSHNSQASEASEHLVHRRCGTKYVRVLHGVSVDGERKYAGIRKKAPRSQSLGTGRSIASVIRFSVH